MIWYFYQSQNKITEKKGKIKQKIKSRKLTSRQGRGPAGPAHLDPPVVFPRQARWCVSAMPRPPTCRATSCFPRATSPRLETPRSFPTPFPPPHRLPLPLSPVSSTPEENTGAPSSPHVAIDTEKPPELVHHLHRSRLRLLAH